MTKDSRDHKKHVKLETTLLISFITLIVGFLGGVVFSAFRMESGAQGTSMMTGAENQSRQTVTTEDMEQFVELEKATSEKPEDATAWINLGNAYFDHNLPEKAISAYETALKYQPDNANVWTDLGIMYRRNNQPEKAVEAFDKAQAVDPTHEASLYNKGIVQMHDLNDPAGAAETWGKLLQLNPDAMTSSGMSVKELVAAIKIQQ